MIDWENLETTVFSLVKAQVNSDLLAKYPSLNFTTEETTITDAKFPNVYMRAISMAEQGQDLRGESINAVLITFQADIITNTSRSDAKTVAYDVIDAFKSLRFEITSLPIFTKEDDVHRATIRARRMVGNGDSF